MKKQKTPEEKMRGMYFSILTNMNVFLGFYVKDMIHEELKVGYNTETTTKFDKDGRFSYLSYTIELIHYCFDVGFDSDLFKYEGVKYIHDSKTFIF